jgi:hypothetical protein
MKRSETGKSKLISWIRSHPEKDYRVHNPNKMAKGMFMSETVAALDHETVKTLSSTRLSTAQVESLELRNKLMK